MCIASWVRSLGTRNVSAVLPERTVVTAVGIIKDAAALFGVGGDYFGC